MSTSDHDVLEAMDRAAGHPPLMHVGAQSILAGGKARRRRRRTAGAGMALAAVVAAVLVWVGWGFDSGMTASEISPATATPWDQEVAFEAPLAGGAARLSGFEGARVERAPSDDHFTVTVPTGDGRMIVERVEGDLPGELELFRNDGSSLVVSSQEYDGEPHLQLSPDTAPTASYETSAMDGDTQVHAWWLEGPVDPASLMDLYWVSEDQLAASSGIKVINLKVSVDGFDTRVAIVPERDEWGVTEPFVGMQPIGGPMGATLPNGVVTVLPEGASDVRSSVSADVVQDLTPGFTSIPLPMTVQQVGGYSVAAAALSRSDFDARSLGGRQVVLQLRGVEVTWTGAQIRQPPEPSKPEPIAAEETQLADGSVRLRFDAGDNEVIVNPSSGGASVVERAGGGWIVVAPQPVLLLDYLEPEPLAVVRTTAGLEARPGPVASGPIGEAGSVRRWVAVGVGDAVAGEGAAGEPLPTMILDTSEGPWWASGDQAATVDEGQTVLDWSIQEVLGLWAVQCTENLDIEREYPPSVGELARPTVQLIRCADPHSMQGFGIVVAVLPTEVAGEATLVKAEHEVDTPVHVSGEPQIVDLGAGRSLWTMQVRDNRPLGDGLVPVHPELNIEGLDLDDDGVADVPSQ